MQREIFYFHQTAKHRYFQLLCSLIVVLMQIQWTELSVLRVTLDLFAGNQRMNHGKKSDICMTESQNWQTVFEILKRVELDTRSS